MIAKPADEEALITALHRPHIKHNLYNFVMFAYPWGQKGTPLEHAAGPHQWQHDDLDEITAHLEEQARTGEYRLFKKATAAGRGPGKSTLDAWLVNWMLTTRIGSTVIVTANTEPQLKTKTFAEISKWTHLLINQHWFEVGAFSVKPTDWFGKAVRDQLKIDTGYYYAQGQLWSEENPDAFAGAHNPLGMLVLFDEASGIPNSIFNVTQGFFTEKTPHRIWIVNSNPRRNSGGFYECFHPPVADPENAGLLQPWRTRHLDARTVEGIDQAIFNDLIARYGIDSDVVRIEVLGQFPRQGDRQFIANDLVRDAQQRELVEDPSAPLIMGVDIARLGGDSSVIRFRRGRDARSMKPIKFTERDNMWVANKLAEIITHYNPDAVNIDAGNGVGVIDRLREKQYRVHDVWFGASAFSKEWANRRTELYAEVRTWLRGGCVDYDPLLFSDLTAPEYDYFGKAQDAIILEPKDMFKGRLGHSPDDGDALALTFATRVARKDLTAARGNPTRQRIASGLDYPIFDR